MFDAGWKKIGSTQGSKVKPPSASKEHRLLIAACLDHGVPFAWRGPGTLLIKSSDLPKVLPVVMAAGAIVLGFEGFEVESPDILPRLDLIFDAERRTDIANPLRVVEGWPAEVWVDVTLRIS